VSLTLVAAPAKEPITVASAKVHLRVDTDHENQLIDGLIKAAREYVESATGRALITQTWDLKLDRFPCEIELPKPPVFAVSSITYLDATGASQTWASSNYRTDLPAGPRAAKARITPGYGVSYPSTYDVLNAVTVRFVCGYGDSGETVPSALLQAMLLLVGHWYQAREAVAIGVGIGAVVVPLSVEQLLWPYRVF
jgi:uncharacterized phiE125 gp8 family phage protein